MKEMVRPTEGLVETPHVMILALDLDGTIKAFNEGAEKLTGRQRGDLIGKSIFDTLLPREKYAYPWKVFQVWKSGGASIPAAFEGDIFTRSGEKRFISWRFNDIVEDGKVTGIACFGFDVSEEKKTEREAVSRSEELLALHRISDIMADAGSLDNTFQAIVEEVSLATGFPVVAIASCDPAKETLTFKAMTGGSYPSGEFEVPLDETLSASVIRTGLPLAEKDVRGNPGLTNPVLLHLGVRTFISVPMSIDRKVIGVLCLGHSEVVEIEDRLVQWAQVLADHIALLIRRREGEEALREQRRKFETLTRQAPFGLALIEKTGDIIYVNPKFQELFGYTLQDVHNGKECLRKAFPEATYRRSVIAAWIEDVKSVVQGERVPRVFSVRCKDGGERVIKFVSVLLESGEVLLSCEDITETVQTREALWQSDQFNRTIISGTGEGIIVYDRDLHYVVWNRFMETLTGFPADQTIGKYALDLFPDLIEKSVDKLLVRALAGETVCTQDRPYVVPNTGKSGWVSATYSPHRNSNGEIIGVIGVVRDVTERKIAEDGVSRSLREKEVLLREIHHRVKNNLQVISSLLYLQSKRTKNAGVVQTLRESQDRIRSMALIHETLYRSRDLGKIDLAGYVKTLTSNLSYSYGDGSRAVPVRTQVDKVALELDTAIPCGLMINELVSNAFRHAFPNGKQGRIDVKLTSCGENGVSLAVSDNGVGLPRDLDMENTPSLGLKLVSMLVEQLSGSVEIKRKRGTTFQIRLPVRKRKQEEGDGGSPHINR